MKKKLVLAYLALVMCLGLAGCKSSDYNKALKLEDSKDYSLAATIYEKLDEYKDSSARLEHCNTMIDVIEKYNMSKSAVQEKNRELDSAISIAETLISKKEPALDETLVPALETAISDAKAEKKSILEMPEIEDEIIAITNELNKL